MKYYRVKYGYGKDEFYSIQETDLHRAIKAQGDGSIFLCEEGTISGNNIMAIHPDYNRLLGVNRDYQLTGEDYQELPSGAQHEHMRFIEDVKHKALGGGAYKQLR